MGSAGAAGTGMISVAVDRAGAHALCEGTSLVVAACNGPSSHVLAGPLDQVEAVRSTATRRGVSAVPLPVSHAFHSPAMSGCVEELHAYLRSVRFRPPRGRLVSTVLGREVTGQDRVDEVLAEQLVAPVRFWDAVEQVLPDTDLFCEAGPGHTLSALIHAGSAVPTVGPDPGNPEDGPLAETAAGLFAAGAIPTLATLFADRPARPIDIWRERVFLTNPCSSSPGEQPDSGARAAVRQDPMGWKGMTGGTAATVLGVLAEATELHPTMIPLRARLLDDLHLSSLRVAQLVTDAARAAGRQLPPETVPGMTGASVSELITTIDGLPPATEGPQEVSAAGVAPWLRCFVEAHAAEPIPVPETDSRGWRTHIAPHHSLSELAGQIFGGKDVNRKITDLVYLPDAGEAGSVPTILGAARAAIGSGTLVVVTHDSALSGFLRALRYEHPDLGVTLLRVPATIDGLLAAVPFATAEPGVWRELVIGSEAARTEQVLCPLWRQTPGHLPIGPGDVLLVTGGGKGIGNECALALARATGATLALLGRSSPDMDGTLRANLDRLDEAAVRWAYEQVDVADRPAVALGVRRLTERLGPVTAVLHASGVNEPMRFTELGEPQLLAHLGPKVSGLRNVLAALDPGRLRMLVTFGSVIGRYGLAGECHYALANGVLRAEAERLATTLSDCRVLNVDWSIWSGSGMGERLGVLDTLRRLDVTPIPADEGVEIFLRLLRTPRLPASVAVHGRIGGLVHDLTDRPVTRFVRDVRAFHPEVELVADTVLDLERDAYLDDHRIDGLPVLPAVVGLEAMAQAATAVAGDTLCHAVDIAIDRPIVVPEHGSRTIRVCALRRDDVIDVVLRCDETVFQADHMRATFPLAPPTGPISLPDLPRQTVSLGPGELYGPLYFHTGRFRLVRGFSALGAWHCHARLAAPDGDRDHPFGGDVTLLGELTSNDATVHALQACVPHRRVVPVGCERLTVAGSGPARELYATERHASGGEYVWDVVAIDADARLAVSWTGLRLRDVGPLPRSRPWPPALLAIYLQRSASALGLDPGLDVRITVGNGVVAPQEGVCHSERDGMVLTVRSNGAAACGWVPVDELPDEWSRLTGAGFGPLLEALRHRLAEPPASIAARLRTVFECLSRIGYPPDGEIELRSVHDGDWAVFQAGTTVIGSVVVPVSGVSPPAAVAILTEKRGGGPP